MYFVHMGHCEELSFQRMETVKGIGQIIKDIEKEYGIAEKIEDGDYSTRLTYDDRCFYITSM